MQNALRNAAAVSAFVVGLVGWSLPAVAQDAPAPPVEGAKPKPKQRPAVARTAVPGSHISLAPPAGFAAADRFLGFGDEERMASIMITEQPSPFDQASAGMRDDKLLATRGMRVLSREDIRFGEREAFLVRVTQSAAGVDFEKFIVVTPVPGGTAVVAATFRVADADALRAPLEKAVRGLVISETKHPDVVPFAMGESPRLELAHQARGLAVYCRPGTFGKSAPGAPLVVVARSIATGDTSDHAAFARRRLRGTARIKDVREIVAKELELDGLPTIELTALATRDDAEGDMFLLHVMLFDEEGGYWLIQAMVAAEERADWEPEFRAMVEGFRRTKPSK